MEHKEVWADWVSLCPNTVPSKWKPKYLRLSSSKLEYFDSNPTPTQTPTQNPNQPPTQPQPQTQSQNPNPNKHESQNPTPNHAQPHLESTPDDTSQSPPTTTFKPTEPHTFLSEAPLDGADDNKSVADGSPKLEHDLPLKPSLSTVEGEALDVPKRAASVSLSQGSLRLASIAGYCLLGKEEEDAVDQFPLARFHVDQCSRPHRLFHKGPPMLLVVGNAGEASGEAPRIWRIRFEELRVLQTFVACIEHAVDCAVVRASGWLHAAGKLNWNRRYCVLLSTGNLLVFRDSRMDELRRNIPLGVSSTIHTATDEDEEPAALLAKAKSGVRFEALRIKIVSPHIPEKKGYGFCVDGGNEATPQELVRLHKQWLRILRWCSDQSANVAKQRSSVIGARELRLEKYQQLRNAAHSRWSFQYFTGHNVSIHAPSRFELFRAGVPQDLRLEIWSSMCTTEIAKEQHLHTEVVGVALDAVASGDTHALLSKLLTTDHCVGISVDLAAIASVLVSVRPKADVESKSLLQLLKAIVCDVSNGYHLCSATTKRTVLNKEFDLNDVSLEVSMDVKVVYEILEQVFPLSVCNKVSRKKIDMLFLHWLLSAFSYAVPFPKEVTLRLWDVLMLEHASSQKVSATETMIRIGLSIIVAFEPLLDEIWRRESPQADDSSMGEQVIQLLTVPVDDMTASIVADIIIDTAYTDQRIVQFASNAAIHARRKRLWKQFNEESKHNAVLASEWMSTTEDFGNTASMIVRSLNKQSKLLSTSRPIPAPVLDSHITQLYEGLQQVLRRMHQVAGTLSDAVVVFRRNLHLAKTALDLKLPLQSNIENAVGSLPSGMCPNDYTLAELRAESDGAFDVKRVRGPQVELNPRLAHSFAKIVAEVGWEVNAILWECFHLNECVAFGSMNCNVRMAGHSGDGHDRNVGSTTTPGLSIREFINGSSLVNLASILVPEGEVKASDAALQLALGIQEDLLGLLDRICDGLLKMAKCLAETMEGSNRAASSRSQSPERSMRNGTNERTDHYANCTFGSNISVLQEVYTFVLATKNSLTMNLTPPDEI